MRMKEEIIKQLEKKFPDEVFLTPEDICRLLACKQSTVMNWLRRPEVAKRPPSGKLGRMIRFPRDLFVRWLVESESYLA